MAPPEEALPQALVQRWNYHFVEVLCPYCTRIHRHRFGNSYDSNRRVPHCGTNESVYYPSYRFVYPFSMSSRNVTYEVDKRDNYFVALNAIREQQPIGIEDAIEIGLGKMSLETRKPKLRSWDDAKEVIEEDLGDGIPFQFKTLELATSEMILGNLDYVQEYLQSSSESKLFLRGVDSSHDSCLTLAACEQEPAMVELLLEHKADPNHQNERGRSPLMEAALFGRLRSVQHLLKYGANKALRDKEGQTAIAFATASIRNDEERGTRLLKPEDGYKANEARRVIYALLQDHQDLPDQASTQIQSLEHHSFKANGDGTIKLFAPIQSFVITTRYKTIATLYRPSHFPMMAAMSGWAHDEDQVTVSGRQWTDDVMRISEFIGYRLQHDDERDHGSLGKFHASHAEKQLIACFISKHVVLTTKYDPPESKHVLFKGDNEYLQNARPPISLKEATILVSRPMCNDCDRFLDAVNTQLDLSISVRSC